MGQSASDRPSAANGNEPNHTAAPSWWRELPVGLRQEIDRATAHRVDELIASAGSMASVYEHLTRHIPAQHLTERLRVFVHSVVDESTETSKAGHTDLYCWQERLGAYAFCDISGFTAWSDELLRSEGRRSGERIVNRLNSIFTRLHAIVECHGGEILKFGGDAMHLFFASTTAVDDLCRCTNSLQAEMDTLAEADAENGLRPLRMSIGGASGRFRSCLVGDANAREFVLAGTPYDAAKRAENAAKAGEILVSTICEDEIAATMRQLAGASFTLTGTDIDSPATYFDIRNDRVDTSCKSARANYSPFEGLDISGSRALLALLASFLPRVTLGQLLSPISPRITEATLVFISLVKRADAASAGDLDLNAFFRDSVELIDRHGGRINKFESGKLLVVFGALGGDTERSTERAYRCCVEIGEQHRSAVGISTGLVVSGQVGAERRLEDTVIGDPVNMAARFNQAASTTFDEDTDYKILLTKDSFRRTERLTGKHSVHLRAIRGKAGQTEVFSCHGLNHERYGPDIAGILTGRTAFVGRQTELAKLRDVYAAAASGHGQIATICGEAGIGKSSLLAEILAEFGALDTPPLVLGAQCELHHKDLLSAPLKDLLRAAIGLTPNMQSTHMQEVFDRHLERLLEATGDLANSSRFFTIKTHPEALGSFIELPGTAATSGELDEASQDIIFRDAATEYLDLLSIQRTVVLFIEDSHHLDAGTAAWLHEATARLGESRIMLLCLERRETAVEQGSPTPQKAGRHQTVMATQTVWIDALNVPDIEQLLMIELGIDEFEHDETAEVELPSFVHQRSHGAPFFAVELIGTLVTDGFLARGVGHLLRTDGLEKEHTGLGADAVVIGRLNRLVEDGELEPVEVERLGYLACAGRETTIELCDGLLTSRYGDPGNGALGLCAGLIRCDLLRHNPKRLWFTHGLIQETVYRSLFESELRERHAEIGQYIEKHSGNSQTPEEHYEALAFLFDIAADLNAALVFATLAGQKGLKTASRRRALNFLETAKRIAMEQLSEAGVGGNGSDKASLIGRIERGKPMWRWWLDALDCYTSLCDSFGYRDKSADAYVALNNLTALLLADGQGPGSEPLAFEALAIACRYVDSRCDQLFDVLPEEFPEIFSGLATMLKLAEKLIEGPTGTDKLHAYKLLGRFYHTYPDVVSGENLRAFQQTCELRRSLEQLTPSTDSTDFPLLLSMRRVIMEGVHKVFYYWKPTAESMVARQNEIEASGLFPNCDEPETFKRRLHELQQHENDEMLALQTDFRSYFHASEFIGVLARNGELSMQRAALCEDSLEKRRHLSEMYDAFTRARVLASESLNMSYLIRTPIYLAEYHDLMCNLPDEDQLQHQAARKQLLERALFFLTKSPNPVIECTSLLSILDVTIRFEPDNPEEISDFADSAAEVIAANPQATSFFEAVQDHISAEVKELVTARL